MSSRPYPHGVPPSLLLMMSPTVLVEAWGIARRHPDGDGWLLDDVSLEIHGGQRLGIEGPSGSGKTLLLRALALLDPLDRGQVRWQGRPIDREDVPCFRRHAIYLHQRPALWEDTVEQALRQPFSLKAHRRQRFEPQRILQWLDDLGRDASFLNKPVRELSGGERQIVALLRAIQLDPWLLLLDEPTASLDATTARAVESLLDRWMTHAPGPPRAPDAANSAGAGARAIVWVSHDAAQARRVADRTLLIEAGRVVREARP